jgi:drug/metabolite transporter (DMT)-like permease
MIATSVSAGTGLMFARLAYTGGTNTITLQVFRFALVVVVLPIYFLRTAKPWRLSGGDLWLALGLGVLHGVSSYTYVGSLQFIPTSLAVIIVYTYPPLVSLLAHFAGDERLTWRRLAALGLSFPGLAVALEFTLEGLDLRGVFMAFLASSSFACVLVVTSRLMRRVAPPVVQYHIAAVNLVLLGLVGLAAGSLLMPSTPLGWLGLIGMSVTFLVAFLGFGAAVHLIGPANSAILNNLEPVMAILLSILVLHEAFGPWQLLGGGMVLAGMVLAR